MTQITNTTFSEKEEAASYSRDIPASKNVPEDTSGIERLRMHPMYWRKISFLDVSISTRATPQKTREEYIEFAIVDKANRPQYTCIYAAPTGSIALLEIIRSLFKKLT